VLNVSHSCSYEALNPSGSSVDLSLNTLELDKNERRKKGKLIKDGVREIKIERKEYG
jgi:hypothetical protein